MNETNKTHVQSCTPPQSDTLAEHKIAYRECAQCGLGCRLPNRVLYRGDNPDHADGAAGLDVLFIGEGPGREEQRMGVPFIGQSGCRLDLWICAALRRAGRFTYGITNMVACRPTATFERRVVNRKPIHHEMDACRPRLRDLIDVCKPRVFVSVGNVAKSRMSEISLWSGNTIPDYHIVHPSYVIRNLPYLSNVLTSDCTKAIDTIITAAILGRKARMDALGITPQDIVDTMPPKAGEQ